uniref:Uncharacterized protein n=1 Tax=Astyanax mexicanus TaxID=7994 RepID=A0A3B1J8N7_ASTMX
MTEETRKLAVAISTPEVKESAIASVKIKELAPFEQPLKTEGAASVKTLPCVELSTMDIREDSLSSSDLVGAESRSTIDPPKCPTLLIVKNRNSGSLEAKNVTEEISDIQHLKMATNEQSLCTSDTQLQASSSESDIVELSSSSLARVHSEPKYCAVQRSFSAHSRGSSARSCTVLRTPNVITPISQCGTARKSRKATHTLQKDSSGCRVISNRMLPRKNARKSTRGCKFIGGCWELKTVRTLRKCAENGSGNCPVTMPEITTLITPKHALAKPDGVPPLDVLFAGDCLIQSKEQSSPEQPSDTSVQQDKYAEIPTSVADNDVQTEPENPKDSPSNVVDINVPCTEVEVELVTENLDAPIPDGTLAGPETEDITENTTTEAMLSPSSDLDMPQDVAHDSDNLNSEDLKDENKSSPRDEQQIEAIEQIQVQELNPEMQVATFTGAEKNADLQMTETNLNSEDGTKATEDNTAELGAKSDLIVEEIATNEQPETSKEEKIVQKTPERSSPKKGAVKSIVSSDRCLRSRVSKGTSEQTPQPEMPVPTEVPTELLAQSDVHEKSINTQESKPPLKACKLNEVEETMPSQDDQNNLNASESPKTEKSQKSPVVSEKPDMGTTAENMVCTRRKQKVKDMMVKESESDKEKDVLEVSNAKDEVVAKPQVTLSGGSSNEVAENVEVTPRKTEESPGKSLRSSERIAKLTVKTDKPLKDQKFKDSPSSSLPESTLISVNLPTSGPVLHSPSKFLEVLNENENQHLITDLNVKFDKMQKGWVQMDKEAQPPPKPKNKGDRLKEIWKSKKRIRKPRSLEQQRFSPVQTLFMKSFDLPSICRWFLQSTETKSLVIVKKVNTRLPSETQLCFHSSASLPGSTNGVFPSLQAERLKKHLKKFAIASPVKSTPKTKRLIAKALAEGLSVSKGKEKRETSTATRISTKPHSYSGLIQTSPSESHSKVTANTKNPASARILRKYSNIREKMQVQQKKTLKTLKSKGTSKPRVMPKNISKKEMSTSKGQKSAIVKKVKVLAKKATTKSTSVKAQTPKSVVSKALKGLKSRAGLPTKKVLPKKSKTNPVTNTKTKSKKEMVAKTDLQKSPHTKTEHHKKSPAPKGSESLTSQSSQATDTKPSNSEDQVLTRSQRKVDTAALAQTRSPKAATKRGMEASPSSAKRTRTSK